MRELQGALEKAIQSLPRSALAAILKRKLREAGVKASKKVMDDLVGHLFSGSEAPFVFDRKDDREVVLDLTDEDMKQIDAAVDHALNITPGLTEGIAESTAKKLLKWLKTKWPEQHALEQADLTEFRARLERRWGAALGSLRMMLTIARELHEGGVTKGSALHRHGELFLRLHVRALQVTAEIITLLESGFADGAFGRWRTLHEISVVMAFLLQAGEETIERYETFGVVEAWRNLEAFNRCREYLGYDEIPADVQVSIKTKFDEAITRYGKPFGRPYGWAAQYLGNTDPKFDQIEGAVDRDWQRSHYKMASFNVHAGPHGAYVRLGALEGVETLLAGPSNAGLHEPCQNTAYTLAQVCSLICGELPTLDQLVAMKVLWRLADEIPKASAKAETKLKRDHAKLRSNRSAG